MDINDLNSPSDTLPIPVARDIMSSQLITVTENATLEDAVKILMNHKITGLPVVNSKGSLVGVVSEYDILSQVAKHPVLKAEHFQEKIQFTKSVETISEKLSLEVIIEQFVSSKFRRLLVADANKKLVGIITRRDLIRLFFYRAQLS